MLKLSADGMLKPQNVSYYLDHLQTTFRSLNGFVLETIYKEPRNIHFNCVADTNNLSIDEMKNYDALESGLQTVPETFSTLLQLLFIYSFQPS